MHLSRDSIIKALSGSAGEIREKFGVRKIGLFGSYAEGGEESLSDIDILVEFEKNTLDNYMDLKVFLETLFNRDVDLVIEDNLKPRLRPKILKEVIYAEGL
ncbi:MAG: nucleotidyltransferase family protein [Deltaproteobacteria bacterium]|uniref:Nucleotidyltransferase family protein n=1 Tax=Candidatus Zymogenus saltonus TaxID=2844893 RepID=A0A9D8KBV0_9DELT|nr:nucleotidyltransferase family protein [Candidatus Zymogenus saltonus]